MFDASQSYDSRESAIYEFESTKVKGTAQRATHAPLVLPHIGGDVPLRIEYSSNTVGCMEMCNMMEVNGMFNQAVLDSSSTFEEAIDTQFKTIFSGLNKYDVEIVIKEEQYTKQFNPIVELHAFRENIGSIYIGEVIAELNSIEEGLGGAFCKLFCHASTLLFRAWTPDRAWGFVYYSEWRGNDKYEDAMSEFMDEDPEFDPNEFEIMTDEDALSAIGGKHEQFYIGRSESDEFFQTVKGNFKKFGKYEKLVRLMVEISEKVEYGIDWCETQYSENGADRYDFCLTYEEIFVSVDDNHYFSHLYDRHMQETYESSGDMSDSTASGWSINKFTKDSVEVSVEKIRTLLDYRKKFKRAINKAMTIDSL